MLFGTSLIILVKLGSNRHHSQSGEENFLPWSEVSDIPI
eukprot:10457.XXX_3545_3661_1 [CDS] Oithona nana genome sequencing.